MKAKRSNQICFAIFGIIFFLLRNFQLAANLLKGCHKNCCLGRKRNSRVGNSFGARQNRPLVPVVAGTKFLLVSVCGSTRDYRLQSYKYKSAFSSSSPVFSIFFNPHHREIEPDLPHRFAIHHTVSPSATPLQSQAGRIRSRLHRAPLASSARPHPHVALILALPSSSPRPHP
jgi:hypothetical protein